MSDGYLTENIYIENDHFVATVVDMAFGITRYVSLEGVLNAVENKVKSRLPYRKVKITSLIVKPRDNTLDGISTITLRKNEADSVPLQEVVIEAGSVVEAFSTNEVEATNTDDLDIKIVNAGTAGAITLTIVGKYKVLNK